MPADLKERIKKHIIVRNIFQHNEGVIREYDIKKMGNRPINVLGPDVEPMEYGVGTLPNITYWELERLCSDFSDAAKILKDGLSKVRK